MISSIGNSSNGVFVASIELAKTARSRALLFSSLVAATHTGQNTAYQYAFTLLYKVIH
jgi:hypothetical protein